MFELQNVQVRVYPLIFSFETFSVPLKYKKVREYRRVRNNYT